VQAKARRVALGRAAAPNQITAGRREGTEREGERGRERERERGG